MIGIDRFPRDAAEYQAMYPIEETKSILPKADIVILTLPLDEQTRHFIGREELALMRDGAVIVNIARGAVVDTEALLTELRARRLFAVLDVFEEEPLSAGHPLWDLENALITPHNSFVGENNAERSWNVIFENLQSYTKI